MSRARLLGGLLALILLGCGAVIVLDQQGAFGDRSAPPAQGTTPLAPETVPTDTSAPADPGSGSGYGDLK